MPALTLTNSEARYYFEGRELPQPDPSTYDASAWTPPTHERFVVVVQSDGLWRLCKPGSESHPLQSGEAGSRTIKFARSTVERYLERFND